MSVDERPIASPLSSFRSMYREHYGLVWGAARRFGVDDHHLDDAVQEAFLVAYRRMGTFGGGSAKAWLYGITRRVASNYRRAERRAIRRKDAVRRTTQMSGSRPAEAVEAIQALDRFVGALPERHREIFVLSELEGMTGAEVARTLGLRPSTTYDAIRSLRRRFEENTADIPPPQQLRRLAEQQRPRATARSWSALAAAIPSIGSVPAAPTSSAWGLPKWSALSLGAKTTAVGLGTAAAVAIGLAVTPPSTDPPATPQVSSGAAAAVSPPEHARSRPAVQPARTDSAPPPSIDEPSPPATPVTPRPGKGRSRPARPAAPPPAPSSLAEENALLRDAAAALATEDPARALELANRHRREHPDSPMGDVSVALRVESLCALGKGVQARGEARVFLRRRPGSPLADRIESACPENSKTAP